MSNELKVTTLPVVSTKSALHPIVLAVNNYIREMETPTPVGAAQKFHSLAVDSLLRSEEDEIFYDFDDRYKVKFEEYGRQKVAVFWSPWLGGVSWRIEDDN